MVKCFARANKLTRLINMHHVYGTFALFKNSTKPLHVFSNVIGKHQ